MLKTLKFRVKDSSSHTRLEAMAHSVDYVWNFCNETSYSYLVNKEQWLSGYDLTKLTAGCSVGLGISPDTINMICLEYEKRRRLARQQKLKWRSAKRNLGWVPLKLRAITVKANGIFRYYGFEFKFWQTAEIGKMKMGSFNQDAQGRWYLNITCEFPDVKYAATGNEIGIDLGLKSAASYSDGSSFTGSKATSKYATSLAKAQRARKRRRVAKIHAKIKNTRKDALQKESTRLVNNYDVIAVGDVSSSKLIKTKMAKSVSDAGWYAFKTMLAYKAIRLGRAVKVVDERYSTLLCSACSAKTGPAGLRQLGVRAWMCSSCGASHDRDTNAAKNILARYKALYPS